MAVIGEAYVVMRPLFTGFAESTSKGIEAELAGTDAFAPLRTKADEAGRDIEGSLAGGGLRAETDLKGSAGRISGTFDKLGAQMANWGLPFSTSVSKIGDGIDKQDTKAKGFGQTLSTIGGLALGGLAVGGAAIAAESIHLAAGLQQADAQIAGHENVSLAAAAKIGKAFEDTAGTTIFSANEQAESLAPVIGVLAQMQGRALSVGQATQFMATSGDLAEATNTDLASTTATLANVMQAFSVPLKGAATTANELFNTSRVTGVGLDQLGNVIERLKARLGVATPTVADLGSLLVDLNEHGVKGSRGLLVVNTAVTTLLNSVPKVDAAVAKAANTFGTKLTSASDSASKATTNLALAQEAAQTKINTVQQAGAAAIAAAQTRLQQVQERIAASATASAPTVAQNIELQNAQTAVTKAQTDAATKLAAAQQAASASVTKATDTQSTAQQKLNALQAAGGASTNAQVQAMQRLGLQVYNNNGTFVGMDQIIAQLQPKIAGMTQEQQLATLSQVFGASASKALLSTVLAGPEAYAKAQKAVTDSSTAHKAATEQNQTMQRQLEILRATLVDEGDKLGTWLIPKVRDLSHWTADSVQWLTKHKDIALALAGVVGGILAVTIGAFVVNTGVKWVKSIQSAGKAMADLATTVLQKLGIIKGANDDNTANAETNASETNAATESIAETAQTAAGQFEAAIAQFSAAVDQLVASLNTGVTEIDTKLDSIAASADETASMSELAFTGMAESLTESGLVIMANNEKIIASNLTLQESFEQTATVAGAAGDEEAVAGETGAAGAAAGKTGLLAKLGLGGGAAAGEGEGALAGVGGASGVLTAGFAGLIAYQVTGQLLKSTPLGHGVTSAATGIANFFGAGPAQAQQAALGNLTSADIPYLQQIIAGQIKHAPMTKAEAIEALKTVESRPAARGPGGLTLSGEGAKEGTLKAQLNVLGQLQTAVYLAHAAGGVNSTAYKTALGNLYSTESKWLPSVSKGQDVKGVERTLYIANASLAALQAKQQKLASEGTIADSNQKLEQLKSQLKLQEKAGASESTLKTTKDEIKSTQTHIDQLKAVQAHIASDATLISQTTQLRQRIDQVNFQMLALRNEIKTNPPPKITSKGTYKLVKG